MKNIFSIFFILFMFIRCGGGEEEMVEVSKDEIMLRAIMKDPDAKEIVPKDINSGFKCETQGQVNYNPGCVTGLYAQVRGLRVILIEYENEMYAADAAKRFNTYYWGQWLFDDVTGEPPLENFMETVYPEAKNPRSKKNQN